MPRLSTRQRVRRAPGPPPLAIVAMARHDLPIVATVDRDAKQQWWKPEDIISVYCTVNDRWATAQELSEKKYDLRTPDGPEQYFAWF